MRGRQGHRAALALQPRPVFWRNGLLPLGLAANWNPLFPCLRYGRLTGRLPLPQANVHLMIQRRAKTAKLRTKIGAHSFRATSLTTYLQNGGKLEILRHMAGHESARTTRLYDRRSDEIALDEVERIVY